MSDRFTLPLSTRHEFEALAEPHRRELLVHCYRMLGSLQDAEDLVQETMLRAWNKRDTFQGRGPFRAWLYQIATFACLNTLTQRKRATLPHLGARPSEARDPVAPPNEELVWLEPFPDDLLVSEQTSPHALYEQRETISLAFVAALQALPPRQRAVLLLCDVLDWRAAEVAGLLETTLSAVSSALRRARVTLAKRYHHGAGESIPPAIDDPAVRLLLERYIHAWEARDVEEFISLLRQDAVFEMPPSPAWYSGPTAIGAFAQALVFGEPVQWKLLPVRANSAPAFGIYRRAEPHASYLPFGLQVLTLTEGQVAVATTFLNSKLFPFFDLPPSIGRQLGNHSVHAS